MKCPNPECECEVEPKWLPIETAPKEKDITILGWDGYEAATLGWFHDNDTWGQISDSGRLTSFEPTHWMPIPPPPNTP